MSESSKYPILPLLPLLVGEEALRPLPDMFGQPVVPPNPRPFPSPSNKQVYVYRGEGNNGELKVFGTFAKLKKYLLDRHSGIYPKSRYSKEEFLEVSQGWGFTIEEVDYY